MEPAHRFPARFRAADGGIDITFARWDTAEHRDDDPRRRSPGGLCYRPWHDLAMLVDGDAAVALGDLARERWLGARGEKGGLEPCRPRPASLWPEGLVAEFTDVEIGIARTRAPWRGGPAIREVEALFLDHIARAKRLIYVESQYFTSRAVAEALALRLAEPDPPEIILVTSMAAHSWLQRQAMDTARVRLLQSLAKVDHAGRMHVFAPVTALGTPIYVHAKLMIVDDAILRVGSANLNNRSMGLDSECDLFIDAGRPGNGHVAPAIARLRHRLIAEHCGIAPARAAEALVAGNLAELVALLPHNARRLVPLPLRRLTQAQKALADAALLDPERPEEIFAVPARRQGLFPVGGVLPEPE